VTDATGTVAVRRRGGRRSPAPGGIVDTLVVPAILAGEEAIGALRPAVGAVRPRLASSLRSPRARVAVGVPLAALAVELSASRLHHDGGDPPAPPARIAPVRYAAMIEREARRYRLDPALVVAIIHQESRWDPRARNARSGAAGLMQIAPVTAHALGVRDPSDPRQSIAAGCRYLRQLLERYQGNVRLALAAYNAGPTAVDRAHGVPRFGETRAYVREVLRRVRGLHARAASTREAKEG
jgi:soluble lytic murein transglycosylase-like protein